ncbi:S-protein homolog 8 [Linum perenne]
MFSSTNTRSSILALPLLTVAAVVTTVLLAGIPTSSSEEWWSSIYHIHIINQLSDDKVLKVNCNSSDNENLVIFVAPGTEYKWDFKKHYFFRSTLWQCYVSPQSKFHQNFIVFDDLTKAFDYNVYWVVKNEGIYFRDPSRGVDIFKYKWQPGRLSN